MVIFSLQDGVDAQLDAAILKAITQALKTEKKGLGKLIKQVQPDFAPNLISGYLLSSALIMLIFRLFVCLSDCPSVCLSQAKSLSSDKQAIIWDRLQLAQEALGTVQNATDDYQVCSAAYTKLGKS